jgi:hypothetical protein
LAGAFFAAFLAESDFAAFLAALTAAQRFLCAAAMRLRASMLNFRFAELLLGAAIFFGALTGVTFAACFAAAHRFL